MATTTLLTIDDFERLPAEIAENHELVEGVLIDVSGNTPRHNVLRDRLGKLLSNSCPAGMVITEQEYDFQGNAHGPDVSFFGPAKQSLLDLDKRVQRFVPDLAIEIASASDTFEGLLIKKDRYLQAGTVEVWLIAPRTREIVIYTHNRVLSLRGQGQIETDLMPGLSIDVAELFREL